MNSNQLIINFAIKEVQSLAFFGDKGSSKSEPAQLSLKYGMRCTSLLECDQSGGGLDITKL